jgi:hypothetical protein
VAHILAGLCRQSLPLDVAHALLRAVLALVPTPVREISETFTRVRAPQTYFPVTFTSGRSASGRFLKSCELTRAGEIGSGPFAFSAAVPAGLSNS